MAPETRRFGWWEIATLLLAVDGVILGFVGLRADNLGGAIAIGFVPGVVLLIGLGLYRSNRTLATLLITVGSIASAVVWWLIYPVVLALVVIVGGYTTGRLGFSRIGTASS